MTPLVCLIASLLSAGESQADAVPVAEETIVVTAQRDEQSLQSATSSVSVLADDALELIPATNLAGALDTLPGFLALLSRSGGGPVMTINRGFFGGGEVEYVRVLIDGLPQGASESGLVPWELISVRGLGRAELLRSAGTPLWGDAAMGGVVSASRAETDETEIYLGAGSNGFGEVVLLLPRSVSFPARTSLVARRSDGWRSSSGFEMGLISVDGERGQSRFSGNLSWQRMEDPGPIEHDRADQVVNRFFEEDVKESVWLSGGWQTARERWDSAGWLRFRDVDQTRTLLPAPEAGLTADRALQELSGGIRAKARRAVNVFGRDILVRGGAEGGYGHLDQKWVDRTFGLPSVDDSMDRLETGVWIGATSPLTEAVTLEGSVRWDRIDDESNIAERTESAVSPRLAIHADLGSRHDLRLLWSEAFKAPTLEQRFDRRPLPAPDGSTFTISNEALASQKAELYEVGLRGEPWSSFQWDIALYRMDVQDEIDFDPATFRYENLGATRHEGTELSMGTRHARVAFRGSYTWMRVESLDAEEGGQLKNIPEHHADLVVGYEVGGWGTSVTARWIGARWLDDTHRFPLSSTITADLSGWYSWGDHRLRVEALNVSDERYREVGFVLTNFDGEQVPLSYPAAGRAVRVFVELTN